MNRESIRGKGGVVESDLASIQRETVSRRERSQKAYYKKTKNAISQKVATKKTKNLERLVSKNMKEKKGGVGVIILIRKIIRALKGMTD